MFNRIRNSKNDIQALPAGQAAPGFVLPRETGEPVELSDYKGRPVVLAFYPADFSSVCGNQLALYNEALHMVEEYGSQLIGISVDNVESHRAFSDTLNLRFPILADSDPIGKVAEQFGVYDKRKKKARRALFVIDTAGIIRWQHVSPNNINPGADGILQALESLKG